MWLFLSRLSFLCLLCPFPATHHQLHEYANGDVIVGGLFPVRFKSRGNVSCNAYFPHMFLGSRMMIFAIDEVNRRKRIPNVTLGYHIYDTGSNVSLAMKTALQLSIDKSDGQSCFVPLRNQSSAADPRVKVVIGEASSEVSIAVARILTLSSIPQISYLSSSELLSRKLTFRTFMRTVPSDAIQTKAMLELVKRLNWQTVGIVGSDDEYGKYGSESLAAHLDDAHVCISFRVTLPNRLHLQDDCDRLTLTKLMDTIANSTAEAIVLFTKSANVQPVIQEAVRRKLRRVWIASDSWCNSSTIKALPGFDSVGTVYGFTFKSHTFTGFSEYVSSMVQNPPPTPFWRYHFLKNGSQGPMDCLRRARNCTEATCLLNDIRWNLSLNIFLAVEVITHALRSLMKCDSQQCQRNTSFKSHELLDEMMKVNFTAANTSMQFDQHGDPSLGYDIMTWNSTYSEIIGEYQPSGKIFLPEDLVSEMGNVTVTDFNCYKNCSVGHELTKQGNSCCKKCIRCSDGQFSPHSGKQCTNCEDGKYPSLEGDRCFVKQIEYIGFDDPFVITICIFSILGIVATITVVVIFLVYRGTPIVKAVGGYLSFLELFSLIACFCLSLTFILKPTKLSCMMAMPLFGIAFTLCVSCILANLLQILVGFNFAQNMGGWLKRLNQPPAVVAVIFGFQLVLCSIWLAYSPPSLRNEPNDKAIPLECASVSYAFFGAMLAYIVLLATVGLFFTFNGNKLPDLYKNAIFVTIGMLLVLVVWIVFIPVYIDRSGKYTRAIEAAATIVSSYSMLCCHLVPKCYIMVCRKDLNDEKAITDYIKKHYDQKGIHVIKS